MSPEQARGQVVDKRTDIWAFGCVIHEALTGRAPFARATVSDTIAAILTQEPDWGALPAGTPPQLIRLLERCLAKDATRRLRDIGDARGELSGDQTPEGDRNRSGLLFPWRLRTAVAVAIAFIALLGAGVGLGFVVRREPPSARAPEARFSVAPPRGQAFLHTGGSSVLRPLARRIAAGVHRGRAAQPSCDLAAADLGSRAAHRSRHRRRTIGVLVT